MVTKIIDGTRGGLTMDELHFVKELSKLLLPQEDGSDRTVYSESYNLSVTYFYHDHVGDRWLILSVSRGDIRGRN